MALPPLRPLVSVSFAAACPFQRARPPRRPRRQVSSIAKEKQAHNYAWPSIMPCTEHGQVDLTRGRGVQAGGRVHAYSDAHVRYGTLISDDRSSMPVSASIDEYARRTPTCATSTVTTYVRRPGPLSSFHDPTVVPHRAEPLKPNEPRLA